MALATPEHIESRATRDENETAVKALLRGDKQAIDRARSWMRPVVLPVASAVHCDPDDIYQQVFEALCRNLQEGEFRGDSSLKTYTYNIARRKAADCLRIYLSRQMVPLDSVDLASSDPNPEQQLIDCEEHEIRSREVETALMRMSPDASNLVRLRFIEHMSHKDILAILKTKPGTLKSRISRALDEAKEEIERYRREQNHGNAQTTI
ncbi:MAG TPA: RNA polymerase sigma factor [bacterium]|nr:RNA polymerase sigma factor [bacterium]